VAIRTQKAATPKRARSRGSPAREFARDPLPADEDAFAPLDGKPGTDATNLKGDIISMTEAGVLGWAWDPANPRRAVSISIMHGHEILGTGTADVFDDGTVRQRVGPGIPGFLVKLISPPQGHYPITLTLKADDDSLLGTPLVIEDSAQLMGLSPDLDPASYDGHVEHLKDGVLTGWVWSPSFPNRRVAVELWEGERRIDRTHASTYREDLARAGKGNGSCGFRLELPLSLLDDQLHSLRVRVENSQFEIPGGKITFGPLIASALLDELIALRNEVGRLAKLVNQVVSPQGEFQGTVIQTLSERSAALAEIHRESVERELDALRAFAFDMANTRQPPPSQKKRSR